MKIFFSKIKLPTNLTDGCYLTQDHIESNYGSPWDDYGYVITFKCYIVNDGKQENLGHVKILTKDETNTAKVFTNESAEQIIEITDILNPEKFISLSSDLDYYRKIRKIFNQIEEVEKFLQLICDASFYYQLQDAFRSWGGFSSGILRSGSASEAAIKKGHQIAIGNYDMEENFTVTIKNLPDSFDPITFRFDNIENNISSRRINVLVGENGVGKSHALLALIRNITGIDKTGESLPFFHKIICIAYSPFEKFYTKNGIATALYETHLGPIKKDSKAKKERRRLNVNAYAYIGFKKEDGEFSLNWPATHSVISLLKLISYDAENRWWRGKSKFDQLFDALSRHIEFDAIGLKEKSGTFVYINKDNYYREKLKIDQLDANYGVNFFFNETKVNLSSGQNIYAYMLPSLMAEIEDESLVLIDEPELYLHPTLEIALLDMLKTILSVTKSYAVIATHSPVMVREVDKEAVSILRKREGRTTVFRPPFQTLGESTDRISGEVFDDYYTSKPFQQSVGNLIRDEKISINEIEKISAHVGDEALAYAITILSESDNSEVEIGEL
jgi:ABC-type cobalamin/Fe3+-siderophores transport system ATPase subunit